MEVYRAFISGVPGNVTEKNLENFFYQKYKFKVRVSLAPHKRMKGMNQGFGTLSSSDPYVIQYILQLKKHQIGKRIIEVGPFLTPEEIKAKTLELEQRRIFVRSDYLPQFNLKKIFSRFGEVEDAYAIKDLVTKRVLTFGYVLFKDVKATRLALMEGKVWEKGIEITITPYVNQKRGQKQETENRGLNPQYCRANCFELTVREHSIKPSKAKYFSIKREIKTKSHRCEMKNYRLNAGRRSGVDN